jgi:penicillin amidase
VLTLTGLATGAVWWLVVVRPLPKLDGLLKVPGLRAPVEVRRDSWGIPHIRAENENDLLLAQGYVQAQDRLWQMEMSRRLAAGRLAEIVGPAGVENDRWSLTMGFYRAAGRELESYDDFHRGLLQSYSDGVNACLESRRRSLPLEFRLTGCRPEPWQAVDSLAWAKFMAYNGGGNWQEEVVRALLVSRLGEEKAGDLLGRNLPRTRLLLSSAAGFGPAKAFDVRNLLPSGMGGSNAWVIHGSRTARGFPLLANDVHLPVQVPSAWHEIHLSGGGFDVTGLSWAGFPLVLTGHNRHLAWGAALAHVDNQDIFYEKMNPRRQGDYLFQDQWLPAEHLIEEIRVKGGEPVRHEVWITRHGPILNPVTPRLRLLRQAMALKWAGREPGDLLPALRLLNLSEDRDEFERAAQRWSEPALSLVYGDRAGHIGYVLAGRVPLRAGGDAPGPYPGWSGEYEWTGYLDPADKPVLRNPAEGFIVAANQRITSPGKAQYLGQDFDPGFRAARIGEVLADKDRMTMEDCRRLQMDVKCAMAGNFLTVLKTIEPNRLRDRRGFDILAQWDLNMESDSGGAALWAVLIRRLLENTFRDELGDAADLFFGERWSPREAPNLFSGHSLVILDGLINEPQAVWFDDIRTPEREALADLLVKSLDEASTFVADQLGDETSDWSWGRLHQVNILHPLGPGRLLGFFLNLGPYPGRGWNLTVMQSMVAPGGDFGLRGATAGNRNLYDLGDWELGRGVIAPGESGMYGSPHYRDQVDMWLRGQGHALPYSTEEVNRHSAHVLTMVPGD